MQSGAPLESKILNEFEPELGRIRVDLINGNPNALDKVERYVLILAYSVTIMVQLLVRLINF